MILIKFIKAMFVTIVVLIISACALQNMPVANHTLTFLDDVGSPFLTYEMTKGQSIVFPEAPLKEGHRFIGYDTNLTTVESDLSITPQYERKLYTIRFITSSLEKIDLVSFLYDTTILLPESPEKEGFIFSGWYTNLLDSIPFTQELMPSSNLILYAKWAIASHTVYYETYCDNIIEPVSLYYDELVPSSFDVENKGYRLEGWYQDEGLTIPLLDLTMPDTDITLYAKWVPKMFVLRLVTNKDGQVIQKGVFFSDRVEPKDLEKKGYDFLGWFTTDLFEVPYVTNPMPPEDLTLYAKWIKIIPPFIHAEGENLYLGDDIFRFASFNVPNLSIIEDPDWHMADPFEQEDAIKSVALMGGNVIRTYTFSIVGGVRPLEKQNSLAHIEGIKTYNEALFQSFDKILELANIYDVYLIIPFVDEWEWWGGIKEFSALYGKSRTAFFTDTAVKNGFKEFISYVLNRTNTLTGVRYKDDPMILAWELGNELRSATNPWITEMSTYVKSIDSNHLLLSGRDIVTTADLTNANIDIISSHYYPNNSGKTFAQRARADQLLTKDKKPFIIGEYGLVGFTEIQDMLIEAYQNNTAGTLIWSLRFRNVNGGFYYHNDTPTRSYHYPGFSINDDYKEEAVINLLTIYGHLLQNIPITIPPIPRAPILFESVSGALSWQGQTGSAYFSVERKETGSFSWQVLSADVSDAYEQGPFYVDLSASSGISYDYRVCAFNSSGASNYSNVITVIIQ